MDCAAQAVLHFYKQIFEKIQHFVKKNLVSEGKWVLKIFGQN
jgi:hypothetical protein